METEATVPRYLVERTFPEDMEITLDGPAVVERNADLGVTWLHSYVSRHERKTFCIYDAPAPEAIRKSAALNALPVDRITEIGVFDPYFYR